MHVYVWVYKVSPVRCIQNELCEDVDSCKSLHKMNFILFLEKFRISYEMNWTVYSHELLFLLIIFFIRIQEREREREKMNGIDKLGVQREKKNELFIISITNERMVRIISIVWLPTKRAWFRMRRIYSEQHNELSWIKLKNEDFTVDAKNWQQSGSNNQSISCQKKLKNVNKLK